MTASPERLFAIVRQKSSASDLLGQRAVIESKGAEKDKTEAKKSQEEAKQLSEQAKKLREEARIKDEEAKKKFEAAARLAVEAAHKLVKAKMTQDESLQKKEEKESLAAIGKALVAIDAKQFEPLAKQFAQVVKSRDENVVLIRTRQGEFIGIIKTLADSLISIIPDQAKSIDPFANMIMQRKQFASIMCGMFYEAAMQANMMEREGRKEEQGPAFLDKSNDFVKGYIVRKSMMLSKILLDLFKDFINASSSPANQMQVLVNIYFHLKWVLIFEQFVRQHATSDRKGNTLTIGTYLNVFDGKYDVKAEERRRANTFA